MAIVVLVATTSAFAKEIACIPRAEMGETSDGQHLYERDKDLRIQNLSRIDFDALAITSAEGKRTKLMRVDRNLYKSAGSGQTYYFLTNAERSVVTEFSVGSSAAYVKILLCK